VLEGVLVRSGQESAVVNPDIAPVGPPKELPQSAVDTHQLPICKGMYRKNHTLA
jgi:hypothetical protein